MDKKNNHPSRRDFLKSSSIFFLGNAIFNDPTIAMVAKAVGLKREINAHDFTCELFRASDLLYLKYYFYNGEFKQTYVRRKGKRPLYIYIQLPSQHIAEEMVTKDADQFANRTDFEIKKSYVSGSSWLAFKLIDKLYKVDLSPDALLNWKDNFEMITLDQFAKKETAYYSAYDKRLANLKPEFSETLDIEEPIQHTKTDPDDPISPITTFEAPYKMWLSPIATPLPENNEGYFRSLGEHMFIGDNLLKTHYEGYDDNEKIRIVSPWQNNLVFLDRANRASAPRFKIVRVAFQDPTICESDLLPAPINRRELRELTMRQEYNRDVLSEFFQISSLGTTTNLKYKNENPLDFAIVAWEQKIKYGRDNYASVTFRAIDVFTGLKLLISIVAERRFRHGVSYLQKKYHVAYAEPEKNYSNEEIISRTPFEKIIPQSSGTYFYPQTFSSSNGNYVGPKNAYLVAKFDPKSSTVAEKYNVFTNTNEIVEDNLLEFDYLGYDKNGVEHQFKSKIVFIPAESYVIKSGTFNYVDDYGSPASKTLNQSVEIPDIGKLNPTKDTSYKGGVLPDCNDKPAENYTFSLIKNFVKTVNPDPSYKSPLQTLLENLTQVLSEKKYRKAFAIKFKTDVSYAKIDNLKESMIRKDSTNTTFPTRDILFAPEYNDVFQGTDLYTSDFPLLPALHNASVIISQIDQIQGRTEPRLVKYFSTYKESNKDLDKIKVFESAAQTLQKASENRAFLFFELDQKLENFFTENYKNAGAIANPGIKITHISALDNSISYNETHNLANSAMKAVGRFNVATDISASSVFRELKAEILGISLLDILEHALPASDLPVFTYAKQFNQHLERIKDLKQEFQTLVGPWIADYNRTIAEVEKYKAELQKHEERLRLLPKTEVRAWLEATIQLSGLEVYYAQQKAALEKAASELSSYKTDVLKRMSRAIRNTTLNLQSSFDAFFGNMSLASAKALIITIEDFKKANPGKFKERYLKESLKSYLTEKVQNSAEALQLQNKFELLLISIGNEVDKQYERQFKEITEGIAEAMDLMVSIGIIQREKLRARLNKKIQDIPLAIEQLISKNDINNWILKFHEILAVYDSYKRFYTNLKTDYYRDLAVDLAEKALSENIHTYSSAIAKKFEEEFKSQLENLHLKGAPKSVQEAFEKIKTELKANNLISNTTGLQKIEKAITDGILSYTDVIGKVYGDIETVVASIEEAKQKLAKPQRELENFMANKLKELEGDLKKKEDKLIKTLRTDPDFKKIQGQVIEIESLLLKLKSLTRQKLDYNFNTKKFKKASLGGVIEFLPQPKVTELAVNVRYEIELDIKSLNGLPSIGKQSHEMDSALSNFKLGLLQLLYIDFERVRFVTGSDVKDDFQVQIRNVEFAGFLGFFQAFQEYLKSLSDNLVFDIDASGAKIGYGITIPDITAGAFNFFNLSLSALLVLPFQPNKSMQLHFGIGNELNKFGITVMAIFGGQGYFNIIAEPKRGIVGMTVVLEFGAIFNLDLGVAKGTAYLVGGIYIRKYDKQFELRGYILCVGRLRILALFSASVTFYLGLEGDSNVLRGVCRVTVSHRFSPFFEISVSFEMQKIIKGTKTKESKGENRSFSNNYQVKGLSIADTNLNNDVFYQYEEVLLAVKKEKLKKSPVATITNAGKSLVKNISPVNRGADHEFKVPLSTLSPGTYDLDITYEGDRTIKKTFVVADPESYAACDSITITNDISSDEYYLSYF